MSDPTHSDATRPGNKPGDPARSNSDPVGSDSDPIRSNSDPARSDLVASDPTPSHSAHTGSDSSEMVERRLTDLEIKATYADDLLDQLNQTIYRQQAEIDQLARALKALREQMPDLENRSGPGLLDEVPPHY